MRLVGAVEHAGAGGLNISHALVVNGGLGEQGNAGVVVLMVVVLEKFGAEPAGVIDAVEAVGESRAYFNVLNAASEYGLSFEVWGRLCDRSTPRSTRSCATVFDVMDAPRSECNVNWPGFTSC